MTCPMYLTGLLWESSKIKDINVTMYGSDFSDFKLAIIPHRLSFISMALLHGSTVFCPHGSPGS